MLFKGKNALVVGASRGFGRGVVESLAATGMPVTALARNGELLNRLARETSAKTIVADAREEDVAESALADIRPDLLVVSAGASFDLGPLDQLTWETFSKPWEVDTRITFIWTQAALRAKEPPRHVVLFGSGAALAGSPMSGGYAGAKRMNAFIAEYAMGVATRANSPIRFHCLVPGLSPHTEFGAAAARAYARMAGKSYEEFVDQLPSPPSPADVGAAVLALYDDPEKWSQVAYRISAKGLAAVDR